MTDYFYTTLRHAKQVIISTGMSSLKEISNTLKIYNKKTKITLLHCVSNYPCSDSSLNLNNITTLKILLNYLWIFRSLYNKLAVRTAIGLGCRVIERHITLSKKKGPDHLHLMIQNNLENTRLIRNNEEILGDFEKKQKEEMEMLRHQGKGYII